MYAPFLCKGVVKPVSVPQAKDEGNTHKDESGAPVEIRVKLRSIKTYHIPATQKNHINAKYVRFHSTANIIVRMRALNQ